MTTASSLPFPINKALKQQQQKGVKGELKTRNTTSVLILFGFSGGWISLSL